MVDGQLVRGVDEGRVAGVLHGASVQNHLPRDPEGKLLLELTQPGWIRVAVRDIRRDSNTGHSHGHARPCQRMYIT